MRLFYHALLLFFLPFFASSYGLEEEQYTPLKGEVVLKGDGTPIPFATIVFEGHNKYNALSNEDGTFTINAPYGSQKLMVLIADYEYHEEVINIEPDIDNYITVELIPLTLQIEGIEVKGESHTAKVNKTAFNVQAIAIDQLKNTTANLTDVLSKVSGIRIRESGGVGSDTKISLNGFSGNHVKIFIDGVLQDGNSSFSLSNIPANFAERIEVYSGVAPIEFGSDALGGVINIVTKDQNRAGWDIDASYSYGSFNTHRSDVTFKQQLENGFQYKINAYQNYSENNYKIDNTVTIFDGSISYTPPEIYTVERFNDTYHNEAFIAEAGFRNKSWADIATLSMNYSQYYREIQTGTKQDVVYGDRHREGYSFIPTLRFSKRDLLTKGLEVRVNANYNYGITTIIDTTVYTYNWFGDTQYAGSARTLINRETKDNSWNANGIATYNATEAHIMSLSYSINSSARLTRNAISGTTMYEDYTDPQYTTKGILGLSYMYKPNSELNAQLFGKNYMQSNDGKIYDDSGKGSSVNSKNSYFGYGTAITKLFLNGFQAKLSYELAYRLATTTELFGDSDLEIGSINLKPESSNNCNASLSYNRDFGKQNFFIEGGVVYRNTKDFIRRIVNSDGESAYYTNHGLVLTKGWGVSASYKYNDLLSLGGSFNTLNARDNEKYNADNGNESLTYKQRIPNEPYMYANADATINFYKIFDKKDHLYFVYDLFYQHEFPLYWENFADPSTKSYVPTQTSHNITMHYNFKSGKYNLSLECRNIADAKLYDNYSLQRAGRSYYAKFRVNIGSIN